jgi:hypothetical protein
MSNDYRLDPNGVVTEEPRIHRLGPDLRARMNMPSLSNPKPTIVIRDADAEKAELQMGGDDFDSEMQNMSRSFETLKAKYYETLQPDGRPREGLEQESRNLLLQIESLTMAADFQKQRAAHVRAVRKADQEERIRGLQNELGNHAQKIRIRSHESR